MKFGSQRHPWVRGIAVSKKRTKSTKWIIAEYKAKRKLVFYLINITAAASPILSALSVAGSPNARCWDNSEDLCWLVAQPGWRAPDLKFSI